MLRPKLEVLPPAQQRLWPELAAVPRQFVLYGGTAIALRIGHRQSLDFDFFSSQPFQPEELVEQIAATDMRRLLSQGRRLQSRQNTLTVELDCGGAVKLSFFGGLSLGRVGIPDRVEDHTLLVASSLDLGGTKVAVIQERAMSKDYLDIAALLQSGVALGDMLGAADALYPEQFNPLISLKALTYFVDGDLPALPTAVKELLARSAAAVTDIPERARLSEQIAP